MQWLTDFASWILSPGAQPVIFQAIVMVIAIVLAGLIAALVARSIGKRLIAQRDHEIKAAAIATVIDASTEASIWNSLTPQEQVLADRAVGQADIVIRLLPIRGAGIAADWAAHQLHELKRSSATFGYQLEPAVIEFRDRLLEWQRSPSRARRHFLDDLRRWRVQENSSDNTLLTEQDAWVAQQHHEQFNTPQEQETVAQPTVQHDTVAVPSPATATPQVVTTPSAQATEVVREEPARG